MQPNEITLSVDELNDDTTTADADTPYTRFQEFENRSMYIGDNHVMDARDQLGFYRTFPTVNGNFKGVLKTAFKFTRDTVVDGVDGVSQITSPLIMEVSFSIPVGTAEADVLKLRQTVLALLDRDDLLDPLNNQLMI